jgi:hypothetical protein
MGHLCLASSKVLISLTLRTVKMKTSLVKKIKGETAEAV